VGCWARRILAAFVLLLHTMALIKLHKQPRFRAFVAVEVNTILDLNRLVIEDLNSSDYFVYL
jgi:hypothetical protein